LPEKLRYFQLIESDDRLAVDNRHSRTLKTSIDQLFHRGLIGRYFFFDKLNALLRLELYLFVTRASAGCV